MSTARTLPDTAPCPCGGGAYGQCCGPLHAGRAQAVTAEALMRSRYSAYALGLDDHVFRTWHPRMRPTEVDAGGVRWRGLEIVDVVDGQPGQDTGVVEFVARFDGGAMHERSRFERRANRWFYLDGEVSEG